MTLPNFLVVGANRAGTTAMHSFLAEHPDIYMSGLKEPSFFALFGQRPDATLRDSAFFSNQMVHTLEAYEALFSEAGGHKAIGESSTAYLPHPHVPTRIKSHLPAVRVIAILRDPADRAFSNYSLYRQLGLERANTFRKSLVPPPAWTHDPNGFGDRYVSRGFYASAVQRYHETFGRERVRIYLYEDWTTRPRDVLKDVFRFLEIDDSFVPDVSPRLNEASRSPLLASVLHRLGPPNAKGDPPRFVGFLRRLNRRQLLPADRRMLVDVYREDVIALQTLIDRDLSAWLCS